MPENEPNQPKKNSLELLWLIGAGLEFALLIAAPLGAFVFLQNKFNAGGESKIFTVVGILLALAISAVSVGKRIVDYRNKLK